MHTEYQKFVDEVIFLGDGDSFFQCEFIRCRFVSEGDSEYDSCLFDHCPQISRMIFDDE